MPVSEPTIARAAQIILRRAPNATEYTTLVTSADQSALITALLAMEPAKSLDQEARVARAFDAVFDRYDPEPAADMAFWNRLVVMQDATMADLLARFISIRDAGYRDNPCARPVSADCLVRTAADAAGRLLVFALGANKRLYLFRQAASSGWSQIDLSCAIPGAQHGHVQAFDLAQSDDGHLSLAVAVKPRRGTEVSTVSVAAGLVADQSDAGWTVAVAAMTVASGGPAGIAVSNISLCPAGPGALLAVVGGVVAGSMDTYSFDLASPHEIWVKTRLPEDSQSVRQFALGKRGRPGVWVLYQDGQTMALTFTTQPDQYGKTINLSYTNLPANAAQFMVASLESNAAVDIFVAGDGIVVYAANSHEVPDSVASGTALRLLSVRRDRDTGIVQYSDAQGVIYSATRSSAGQWSSRPLFPAFDGRLIMAPPTADGHERFALIAPSGVLEVIEVSSEGVLQRTEIPQRAVWEEQPLTSAELHTAMGAAAPLFVLDPKEQYLPAPVAFFLRSVGLWNEPTGSWTVEPGKLWDEKTADMARAGMVLAPRTAADNSIRDCDYNLRVTEAALPTLSKGQIADAPLYVHAKFRPADNVTEFVFWVFYAFNGPGTLRLELAGDTSYKNLNPLGIHQGDWEHFTIEVDNDSLKPLRVYLSAHDGGAWQDHATLELDNPTGRRILYGSRNGHAAYSIAGDNPFHGASGEVAGKTVWSFALVNICGRGPTIEVWQPGRTVLISATCLGSDAPIEPLWLQFPWRWGRYEKFTANDIGGVVHNVLGPVVGSLPFAAAIEAAVGKAVIAANVLGGEGYAAGPGAIKYKDNWFSSE